MTPFFNRSSLLLTLLFTITISSLSFSSTPLKMTTPTSSITKRILVTGGNKGIGLAICHRLLSKHPDVHVILGSRDIKRGNEAIDKLTNDFPSCQNRLSLLEIDTSNDESVVNAAASCREQQLYAIINNAGIGWGYETVENVNVNYFGPRRVNDAFGKLLMRPGGRIVNIASASGPNFVSQLPPSSPLHTPLSQPWTLRGGIPELDALARSSLVTSQTNGYGISKALLNAYTWLHSRSQSASLVINSVTPGFIVTDMTRGLTATNPPSKGAIPPVWCAMGEELEDGRPGGRYYGSDMRRSPIDVYRGPGEEEYMGTDGPLDFVAEVTEGVSAEK